MTFKIIIALLIAFIGVVMLVNSMVMDTGDIDERRSFAEHEGMLGIGIMLISLLAVAYFCGINYARAHQEPQEKQSIESEVPE